MIIMKKNFKIRFLALIFLFFILSLVTITGQGDFTVEKFWKQGGIITFENDISTDHILDVFDIESTVEGRYEYNGSLSSGELVFNFTIVSPAQEYVLEDTSGSLDPYFIYPVSIWLEEGDAIDYSFTVNGGYIDFIIFNSTQFLKWTEENDTQPIECVELIHTNIGIDDTFTSTAPDFYIFVWWNNADYNSDPISLQIHLTARMKEEVSSEFIEIDPITLETTDDEELTILGMDTSDWEINDEISFEIDKKDVEFTIIRDDDYQITYNGESANIPCWVLEIEGYETTMIEEEGTFTITSDLKMWKSKYSGITLKSIEDSRVKDSDSVLIMDYYEKFEVESADNVLLKPQSSGINFPLLPSILGLIIIIIYKKKYL